MAIQHIHTYLVHPNKGSAEPSRVNGADVPLNGRLFDLLNTIYLRSDQECEIDIAFKPSADGAQQNVCRDLICIYLQRPTLASGRVIAERLEQFTDGRSGLGLLFLIAGQEGREHKVVISRFPTDHAIYVDENPRALTVEFLERVFMKNRSSYKAVTYRHASLRAGMWLGRAIDRQTNSRGGWSSDYWIVDFLASQLTVTAAAGTRRFAKALSDALKTPDLDIEVKQEITSVANLAAGLAGRRHSINDIGDRFGLSEDAMSAVRGALKSPDLADQQFQLDIHEFQSVLAFKSVELNNGGLLTAPSANFDRVFRKQIIDEDEQQARFTTEGIIVNERFRTKV